MGKYLDKLRAIEAQYGVTLLPAESAPAQPKKRTKSDIAKKAAEEFDAAYRVATSGVSDAHIQSLMDWAEAHPKDALNHAVRAEVIRLQEDT